jgi:hypothetical protein
MTVAPVVASRLAVRASLAGRPANPHLPLIPEGLCHAMRPGEPHTLCGLATGDLTAFPGLAFVAASFLLRCDECTAMLATGG